MSADPWQTLGAKRPDEDEEGDRIDIAGFADSYNPDLDGEALVGAAPAGEVPPPRFGGTESGSPVGEDGEMGLEDRRLELQEPQRAVPTRPPAGPPISITTARAPAPKAAAPIAQASPAPTAQVPQKMAAPPQAIEEELGAEEGGEQRRESGTPGPIGEPASARRRQSSWPLVAAIAGAVTLLAGVGTVAFLKSVQPPREPLAQPLPAPPGVTTPALPPRPLTTPAKPPGAAGIRVQPAPPAASASPLSLPPAAGTPAPAPNPTPSPQNTETAVPAANAAGSLPAPNRSEGPSVSVRASSHSIASQLARLERSFQGIKFLVGQITQKESALAVAIQKEQTTSLRDAAVIARQGREIAHLTWLVHHAPHVTVRPPAPPKPKPKPKPVVPPVQLVGIIGHTAWIELPNGALVRIFRGNPIPGTPTLAVRSIQANPPLLVLSNGVHLREAGP